MNSLKILIVSLSFSLISSIITYQIVKQNFEVKYEKRTIAEEDLVKIEIEEAKFEKESRKRTNSLVEIIKETDPLDIENLNKESFFALKTPKLYFERYYDPKHKSFDYYLYYKGFQVEGIGWKNKKVVFNSLLKKSNFSDEDDNSLIYYKNKQAILEELNR